ncbi:MAG: flagellin FliC, partial [Candidatus Methylomirabilis sp.]|nr:flagellin FliC [Deltaproteobacteria bacterium]
TERGFLDTEFTSLVSEVTRIAQSTKFNTLNLLDGSTTTVNIQVGAGTSASIDQVSFTLSNTTATGLSLNASSISTTTGAAPAIAAIDAALGTINTSRSSLGAAQNRLQAATENLAVTIENFSASNSRIRDVDVASETARYTRSQILAQAGSSILAQANASGQLALTLLQG